MLRVSSSTIRAAAGGLLCAIAGAVAAEQPVQSAAPAASVQLINDPRALATLKSMSERLASARSLTVRTDNTVPMLGPNLQWISLVGTARVALERPNGLFIARAGDQTPMEIYYDGKTLTLHEPVERLYAEVSAPATVDATLTEVFGPALAGFPYLALLMSDPFAALTTDLGGALYVGHSMIDGVKTEHLALRSPGVDWEIWIGAEDRLPRLVQAKYLDLGKAPAITTRFHDWSLGPQIPAATFRLEKAAGAKQIDYVRAGAPVAASPTAGK